jgi:hypothetical protein
MQQSRLKSLTKLVIAGDNILSYPTNSTNSRTLLIQFTVNLNIKTIIVNFEKVNQALDV